MIPAEETQGRLRARAVKQGNEWWPVSCRSLQDTPTEADVRAVSKHKLSLTQRQADAITAISNVIFAVALLPTVLANQPPAPLTSLATVVALGMLGVVLLHFKLWWGFAWNIACASMWIILLIQGLS